MANLGTLWFDTKLKNTAVDDAEKIKRQLIQKFGTSVPIKVKVTFDTKSLKADLQTQLASFKPKVKVDIIVDQAHATKIVQDALAKAGLQNNMTAGMLRAQRAAEIQQRMADQHALSLARLQKAQQDAAWAARNHADSVVSLNAQLANGVNISGRLSGMMLSMYSVSTARQFLDNVIEIGGQLEKQRISMGAIIGDTARANDLFDKIKGLAVKSPFGVVELDQYSKQLAAYGIEQSELFDMTKRLADISAGAGQDIGRLALAIGHVKSATYLTGITLRQFSMNNIPMLKMLADYYTEVEKRVVSTAEVQKRISERKVSYDDVIEQIKRMTDADGMFYNMQEKISESVAAKWKNLRDSMDIMYGDLAESYVGDVLKGTAEVLMELTTRWREFGIMLSLGIATMGAFRVATLLSNTALGNNTAMTIKSIMADKKKQVSNLQVAMSYRELTAAELQKWRSAKTLTAADLEEAMAAGIVNKEQVLRTVAMKKLTVAEAQALVGIHGITQAEIDAALAAKKWNVALAQVTSTLTHVGSKFISMVFNWQNAIFVLISAFTHLIYKQSEETSKLEELNDSIFNRAEEGAKNVRKVMEQTGMSFKVFGSGAEDIEAFGRKAGEIKAPMSSEVDGATMKKNIELWTQFIKEYSATPNLMLEAAYATDENGKAVMTLAKRYDELRDKAMSVMNSIQYLSDVGDALTSAIDAADGGWFDDNLLTDMKDFEKAYQEQKDNLGAVYTKYRRSMTASLAAARGSQKFADALKEQNISLNDAVAQMQLLTNKQEEYAEAVELFKEVSIYDSDNYNPYTNSMFSKYAQDYKSQYENMVTELSQVAEELPAYLISRGIDPATMTKEQLDAYSEAVTQTFTDLLTKAGVSVDEVRKIIMKLASEEFHINLDVNMVKTNAEMSAVKNELENLVKEDWVIDIKSASNYSEVIQKIRVAYKDAIDYFANAKPILAKFGFTIDTKSPSTLDLNEVLSKVPENMKEQAKMLVDQYNSMVSIFSNATKWSKATGGTLSDSTQGGKVLRDRHGKGSKSTADKVLEGWRNELNELKEFWREYEKQLKYMESSDAVAKIRESGVFPSLFGKNGELLVDVRKGLVTALDNLLSKTDATTEARKAFQVTIKKARFEVNDKVMTENADALLKHLEEELKERSKQYDLFKKVLDVTGDRTLSSQIAFGDIVTFDNFEEELRSEIEDALKKLPNAVGVTMSDIFDMDDKQLAEIGILEKAEDGIYKKLMRWREASSKLKEENVSLLLEAIKNSRSLETELDTIALKYKRTRDAINGNNNLSQDKKDSLISNADKNEQMEMAKARWDWFKKTTEGWGEMFSDLDRMSDAAISGMITKLEDLLPNIQASEESVKALYEALDKLRNEQINRNPFKGLVSTIMQISTGSTPKGRREGMSDFNKRLKSMGDKFKAMQDALSPVIELFETLGDMSIAQFFKAGSDALGAAAGTAQGFSALAGMFGDDSGIGKALGSAGPYGAAAAAALSLISSVSAMHDAALQKEIEASQARQKEMENLTKNLETLLGRTLGGIYKTTANSEAISMLRGEMRTTNFWTGVETWRKGISDTTKEAYLEAKRTNSYYDASYAAMLAQRDEIQRQYELESDKKDSDASKLSDYKQQIREIDDEIRHFAEDLAKTIYDIDIKSWAEDLGDALVDAWAKGEDAVQAWKDKAANLMADLTKNIIIQKVIEGALSDTLDAIVDEMNTKKGKLDEGSVTRFATEILNATSNAVDATLGILDVLDPAFKQMFGTSLKDAISGGASSSGDKNVIRGDFTEQETGLLLSYVNAIRAHVALDNQMLTVNLPSIMENVGRMSVIAEQQVMYQRQIADNTMRNADAADRIYDILHRASPTGEYISVR